MIDQPLFSDGFIAQKCPRDQRGRVLLSSVLRSLARSVLPNPVTELQPGLSSAIPCYSCTCKFLCSALVSCAPPNESLLAGQAGQSAARLCTSQTKKLRLCSSQLVYCDRMTSGLLTFWGSHKMSFRPQHCAWPNYGKMHGCLHAWISFGRIVVHLQLAAASTIWA